MPTLHLVTTRAPFELRLHCISLPTLPHATTHHRKLHSYRPRLPQHETWLALKAKHPIAPFRASSIPPTDQVGLEQTQEDLAEEDLVSFSEPLNRENDVKESATGFVCASHGWGALLVDHNDLDMLRRFSQVQAEVFHTPSAFLNDFFFTLFKAEVLSSVLYKIRNAGPNRFACLVAVPDSPEGVSGKIVGVVDAAAMADGNVLRCLPGTSEYLYISGMAVANAYRRRKVATVLLDACDLIASEWGFEFLVLQAYEDDKAARLLYARNGYKIISIDPWWLSKWFGKRRRVILAKNASPCKI